jgi:dienelactone hydrolase
MSLSQSLGSARAVRAAAIALVAVALAACARTGGDKAADFPAEAKAGTVFNSLYRPSGDGPFPAVVLLHTCGGLGPHVHAWARKLEGWGYVALVVDSFTPRGKGVVCGNWSVTVDQVADDALAALDRLRRFSFVKRDGIGVMGFSYGAMAALRLASQGYQRDHHPTGPAFQAAVALYPYCTSSGGPTAAQYRSIQDNLYDDIATPTLILVGEADNEAPATLCTIKTRRLAALGEPISVTVFPGATHAFDLAELGGREVRKPEGYVYRYDPDATAAAGTLSHAFFDKYLRISQ